MNINPFGKYKVAFTNEYDYVSDFDFDRGDYVYAKDKTTWEREMQGEEIIDVVANFMLDHDVISLEISDNKIVVEAFKPCCKLGDTICIKYEEVKDKQ